ncbi:MAG: hypothetical protein ACYC1P_06675 [Gaiellaceae bacterium]
MEQAYEAKITVRFRVEADAQPDADALAERFAWGASSWLDASGSPPWTRFTMVVQTDVDAVATDASTAGLLAVSDRTLDEALGR